MTEAVPAFTERVSYINNLIFKSQCKILFAKLFQEANARFIISLPSLKYRNSVGLAVQVNQNKQG